MAKRGRTINEKLAPVGRVIRATGAARFYHDGDGAGFVWRWWHPLSWFLGPLALAATCIVAGVPEAWRHRHEAGFGMNPWFKENADRLEWE